MPPPVNDGRRESFARFAADKLFFDDKSKVEDEPPKAAPSADAVRRQNRAWERHLHSAALLGYSFQQCFVVLLCLVPLSSVEWSIRNEDGVSVLNQFAVIQGIFLPLTLLWIITSSALVSTMTHIKACL